MNISREGTKVRGRNINDHLVLYYGEFATINRISAS